MGMDDNDGQMMFGDLGGLKLPDICLTGEEKPRKNFTQETCPDRVSNPGPLRDKRLLSVQEGFVSTTIAWFVYWSSVAFSINYSTFFYIHWYYLL